MIHKVVLDPLYVYAFFFSPTFCCYLVPLLFQFDSALLNTASRKSNLLFFLFLVFGEPLRVFRGTYRLTRTLPRTRKEKPSVSQLWRSRTISLVFCVKRQVEKARPAVTILRFLRLLFPLFVPVSLFKYFTLRTQRKGEEKKST